MTIWGKYGYASKHQQLHTLPDDFPVRNIAPQVKEVLKILLMR